MVKSPNPKSHRSFKSSNWSIDQLPGLNSQDLSNLQRCGIETTLQLVQRTQSLTQKQALAAQLRVHIQYVHRWAALADLTRVPSVGCQYSGLLLHTGICSAAQLAQMPLDHLKRQVLRFYVTNLQRRDLCPTMQQMVEWIQQARQLSQVGLG